MKKILKFIFIALFIVFEIFCVYLTYGLIQTARERHWGERIVNAYFPPKEEHTTSYNE